MSCFSCDNLLRLGESKIWIGKSKRILFAFRVKIGDGIGASYGGSMGIQHGTILKAPTGAPYVMMCYC